MPKHQWFSNFIENYWWRYKPNAMSFLVWMLAFCGYIFWQGVLKSPNLWVQVATFALIGIVVIYCLVAFSYFMIKDPDRLQSESFLLKKQVANTLINNEKAEDIRLKIDNKDSISLTKSPIKN